MKIRNEVKRLGMNKVLIVTDRNIVKLGIVERISSLIKDLVSITLYDSVKAEPTIEDFNKVANFVRNDNFDGIIGIGGGSSLDTAKIASIAVTNPGDISQYIGRDKVRKKGVPLILVPTTAGTGSEVTRVAVAREKLVKHGVTSDYLLPDVAIVDPELTITLPPKLTAITGLDALSHALEGLTSTLSTPLTDSIAMCAVALILKYLRKAYRDGKDLEARAHMSLAATMAGLVISNTGVTLGHFIGETIGPIYNIPHGLAVGITIPYVLEFYLDIITDKFTLLEPLIRERKSREELKDLIKELVKLYTDLNIPLSFKELNIPRKDIPKLAEITMKHKVRMTTPIKLSNEVLLEIYERIWNGAIYKYIKD